MIRCLQLQLHSSYHYTVKTNHTLDFFQSVVRLNGIVISKRKYSFHLLITIPLRQSDDGENTWSAVCINGIVIRQCTLKHLNTCHDKSPECRSTQNPRIHQADSPHHDRDLSSSRPRVVTHDFLLWDQEFGMIWLEFTETYFKDLKCKKVIFRQI